MPLATLKRFTLVLTAPSDGLISCTLRCVGEINSENDVFRDVECDAFDAGCEQKILISLNHE